MIGTCQLVLVLTTIRQSIGDYDYPKINDEDACAAEQRKTDWSDDMKTALAVTDLRHVHPLLGGIHRFLSVVDSRLSVHLRPVRA